MKNFIFGMILGFGLGGGFYYINIKAIGEWLKNL